MATGVTLEAKLAEKIKARGLILYDGDCGFCQFWVQFVLDHDSSGYFVFAPLQAAWTQPLHGLKPGADFQSVLLLEGGRIYHKSRAALRIASRLGFPWNLVGIFSLVPVFASDFVYDFIARRRRGLAGGFVCRIPLPGERERFIKDEAQ